MTKKLAKLPSMQKVKGNHVHTGEAAITLILSTNTDQKSLETVFSIAICRQFGDKWQLKTQLLTIFYLCLSIVLTFLIVANPCLDLLFEQQNF